ncbi:metallophosphoesterase family protein [Thermovibrio ammonificans]|uniref:Metallophosphoesterase n=1 Tax=Thermovibrio ammonificans (strain DSM 15698 / JCM 12110 / HB-1) TaxID=648996 RepID=E8T689_THEA1|nr:exonuclease SbcCD subunit D [Thermovibrio ammonificans]ADU96673.1 metallophosphoesterase [Thermovibrio ammonificans HB-1]
MKIAHLSDSHLGYMQYHSPERKRDFLDAFKLAVERALELGAEVIVHTGDLFESYQPDMESLDGVIQVLRQVKERKVPFVAITGNHDRAMRRGVYPPHKLLENLGLLELIDPLGTKTVKGVLFAGLRYHPRVHVKRIREQFFDGLSEEARRSDLSVFMFHQALDFILSYEGAYELLVSELPEGFDYYAAGHVHLFTYQKLSSGGLLAYAGATEFRSKQEAQRGRRGFNLVNLETGELERVELEGLRPFVVESFNQENAREVLKELLEKVRSFDKPPVVLLTYTYSTVDLNHFSDLLEQLYSLALAVRIQKIRQLDEQETVAESRSYADYLKLFMGELKAPPKAVELGVELLSASPDSVPEIVEHFVREELGELYGEIEERLKKC